MVGQSRDGELLPHLLLAAEIGAQQWPKAFHRSPGFRAFSRRRAVPSPHSRRSEPMRKPLCESTENRHDRPLRLMMILKDQYGSSDSQVPNNLLYFLGPSTI